MQKSTAAILKLLVFLILIVVFVSIYKASILHLLMSPVSVAVHYAGIAIIFFKIVFIIFILIDSFKDDDNRFI